MSQAIVTKLQCNIFYQIDNKTHFWVYLETEKESILQVGNYTLS